MAMNDHILTITDLLLGAAYADKRLEGRETDQIRTLLTRLSGRLTLAADVEARFKGFSPAKFDIDKAGNELAGLGADRRKVLEMVAAVTESDDELDLAEDLYLRRAALAMGLDEKEFRDLVIDISEVDELEGILGETLGV
jgi:uncharacterized tellurite resistance protein B-like protein